MFDALSGEDQTAKAAFFSSLLAGDARWRQLQTNGAGPSPRAALSSVFYSEHRRLLVFGGASEGGFLNDLWALSFPKSDIEEVMLLSPFSPNPFNGRTMLSYVNPHRAAVTLSIFDPSGRLIRTLGGRDCLERP